MKAYIDLTTKKVSALGFTFQWGMKKGAGHKNIQNTIRYATLTSGGSRRFWRD